MSDGNHSHPAGAPRAVTPVGLNHLVLNVRNIEESHRFWTEILGFRQCGQTHPTAERPNPAKMRFYRGAREDGEHHHDVALIEDPKLPVAPREWTMIGMPMAISHIAITLPDREAWLRQLAFLQARGVKFDRRVDHGMTHSVYVHDPNGYGIELLYDLPPEVWAGGVDAALNYFVDLPTEGPAALIDNVENLPVFPAAK